MRTIIKPATLGLLAKPYRYRQQTYLSLGAVAFFRLGETPALIPEHEAWPLIGPALPMQQLLDEAMPKTCADILLAGSAYAPNGEPVKEMKVRLQCGTVDKSLHITGDRQWRYSLLPLQQIDPPLPFTRIPLDLTRAWGGEGYPANPLGCGYTDSRLPAFFKRNQGALPNITLSGEIRRPGRQRYTAAGFGPWSINHPLRRTLAGTYKKRWLKEDFPGLARDIDWRFFNMAPPDQRLKAFLVANESYELTGMHPSQPRLAGHLPGIQARAFIRTRQEQFKEVELNADTLWFFPDQELGVLIFHGQCVIDDSDALDVEAVMLAYDQLDEKRPVDHYQSVMQLRTDPDTRHLHVFNEAQLSVQLAKTSSAVTGEDLRRQKLQARLDEMDADFWASSGVAKPVDYVSPVLPESLLPDPRQPDGSMDLTAFMAAANQKLEQAKEQAKAKQQELQSKLEASLQELTVPAAPAETPVTAEEALARSNPVDQLNAELARMPLTDLSPEQQKNVVDGITQAMAQGRELQRLAQDPISKCVSDSAALELGQLVKQRLQLGQSLAAFNLAGVILMGQSFADINLAQVNFERGNFSHCDFSGADLRGASFVGATLHNCRFHNTQLAEANWSAANLNACEFRDAKLLQCQWSKTQITSCDFSNADLSGGSFRNTQLTNNQFRSAKFDQSIWVEANTKANRWDTSTAQQFAWLGCELNDCTFDSIDWQQGAFLNCITKNLSLANARLKKILITGEASKSLWNASNWRGAKLQECGFRQTQFLSAEFSEASFSNCDFGNTELQLLTARNALFHKCLLMGAAALDGDFQGADFCQSMAMKMNLTGADLQDAQLWRANFHRAQLQSARINNAWPAKNLEVAA
jgi:uncharacterized protein YjbI with pentapeptide repeats